MVDCGTTDVMALLRCWVLSGWVCQEGWRTHQSLEEVEASSILSGIPLQEPPDIRRQMPCAIVDEPGHAS
jgi:hypothetical protein